MDHKLHPEHHMGHLLSIPFIYGMLVPSVFLDLCIEVYHRVCFPLYGLPYVQRSRYIRLDRAKLEYLSPVDRLNCAYCGYVNGLFAYSVKIAGETEKYWCAIKHPAEVKAHTPAHHKDFVPFDDERAFRRRFAGPTHSPRSEAPDSASY